jgi:hypothetical protein
VEREPGTIIRDRYVLTAVTGDGESPTAWRAVDMVLRRPVIMVFDAPGDPDAADAPDVDDGPVAPTGPVGADEEPADVPAGPAEPTGDGDTAGDPSPTVLSQQPPPGVPVGEILDGGTFDGVFYRVFRTPGDTAPVDYGAAGPAPLADETKVVPLFGSIDGADATRPMGLIDSSALPPPPEGLDSPTDPTIELPASALAAAAVAAGAAPGGGAPTDNAGGTPWGAGPGTMAASAGPEAHSAGRPWLTPTGETDRGAPAAPGTGASRRAATGATANPARPLSVSLAAAFALVVVGVGGFLLLRPPPSASNTFGPPPALAEASPVTTATTTTTTVETTTTETTLPETTTWIETTTTWARPRTTAPPETEPPTTEEPTTTAPPTTRSTRPVTTTTKPTPTRPSTTRLPFGNGLENEMAAGPG